MKHLTLALIFLLFVLTSKAQDGFSDLIKSGPGDATKLLNTYASPLFKALGVGMNSGWTNTAKTKSFLHFDIQVSSSATFISNADKSFDVTKIGLSNHVGPADPNQVIAPTIGGSSGNGPLLNIYDDNGNKVESFNTPGGKISVIPVPQIQATIGLIQNTDLTIRGIPSIYLGNNAGTVSMIGFGLKHDILQDFAGKTAGRLIPFDLAIAFDYSHLNLSVPLTVTPESGSRPQDGQQSTDFSNQHVEGHFNSFLIQAIVSKKILFFTPFLAVGYNNTHTTAGTIGNYPITTGGDLTGDTYTTYHNPVNVSETSIDGFRADIGFQLSLAFFRIYASYSEAQYRSVSAGIGFGF